MPRKAIKELSQNRFENSEYALELSLQAGDAICSFFKDKCDPQGRPLEATRLQTDENIGVVLRAKFDDPTFDFIHKCLARTAKPKTYKDGTLSWPVYCLLSLINELKAKRLLKEFQPGLLLLYFKFCKGFDISSLSNTT